MGRKNKKKDNKGTNIAAPETQEVTPILPLLADEQNVTKEPEKLTEVDLLEFRNQWKQELEKNSVEPEENEKKENEDPTVRSEADMEKEATVYFLEAVELERKGDMSEAVQKYAKAFRLVPDIERRVHPPAKSAPRPSSPKREHGHHVVDEREDSQFYDSIEKKLAEKEKRFEAASSAPCHIDSLPNELIELIVRYVVTKNLSHRDLAALSETSAYFYLRTRSSDLWRRIFLKSVCPNTSRRFLADRPADWRHLYMTTPHIMFHGVYAAKTSYIRHGETGFQDEFYRPWHTVCYYRLIRFYPDGHMLMMTTSEQPVSVLHTFKRNSGKGRPDLMQGNYRIDGEYIEAEVIRERDNKENEQRPIYSKKKRNLGNFLTYGIIRQSFSLKLKMIRAPVSGLVWEKNVSTSWMADGTKNPSDLEVKLNSQQFPPHRFFPVKSFVSEGNFVEPLE